MPEFVTCSINEKAGRHRVTVRGYCPIDDTGTLRLMTTAYRDEGTTLSSSV